MNQKKEWEKQIDFNAHDMGEMGKFIRVEYAKNIIKESLHSQAEEIRKKIEELEMSDGFDGLGYVKKSDVLSLLNPTEK